jgi:hypothetical protein
MNRIYCFYRMTDDSGFAPNPFHGYCTLAACTPNHKKASQLKKGDVIVGVESKELTLQRQSKFGARRTSEKMCIVYYMVIDEQLTLDQYFDDPRFAAKKLPPGDKKALTYEQQHGDNVYYKDEKGDWKWLPGHMHDDKSDGILTRVIKQDLDGNRVFIGKVYYYFGDEGVPLPESVLKEIPPRQGIKYCCHPLPELDDYVRDKAAGKLGLIGDPIGYAEFKKRNSCGTP